jgi:hypothetical protein
MRPFPDRFTPIRLARPTRTEVPRVERGSDDLKRKVAEVELQVLRLFKCAVKDDDTLVDVMVEKLYRTMKDFDPSRAKDTVALIVDRDTRAEWKFRALLDDLWIRRPSNVAA